MLLLGLGSIMPTFVTISVNTPRMMWYTILASSDDQNLPNMHIRYVEIKVQLCLYIHGP
jgi:hypothetical protein